MSRQSVKQDEKPALKPKPSIRNINNNNIVIIYLKYIFLNKYFIIKNIDTKDYLCKIQNTGIQSSGQI